MIQTSNERRNGRGRNRNRQLQNDDDLDGLILQKRVPNNLLFNKLIMF